MTRQEYEENYLVVDGMTFTPKYEFNEIGDYVITATAEEVYQEWQAQRNAIPEPTIEDRILAVEEVILNLL